MIEVDLKGLEVVKNNLKNSDYSLKRLLVSAEEIYLQLKHVQCEDKKENQAIKSLLFKFERDIEQLRNQEKLLGLMTDVIQDVSMRYFSCENMLVAIAEEEHKIIRTYDFSIVSLDKLVRLIKGWNLYI